MNSSEQSEEPAWLTWSRRLNAIAQTGLTFSNDPFDIERYEQIRDIAAEMMSAGTGDPIAAIVDLFQQDTGYATPNVDVRGAVFQQDQILLVRERRDGLWTLPGGWADVNDLPSKAIEREIEEESGYLAEAVKLAAVYDKRLHGHPPSPRHTYKLFFICDLIGGQPRDNHEITEIKFFFEQGLPDLSLSRVTAEEIAMLFEHHRSPAMATFFD